MFLTVYSELPYNENWNFKDALAYLCRLWQIERMGCFVAYGDTELEGAIFSFSYPWHAGKLVCIQELFISPSHRRKGIVRSLLHHLNGGKKAGAWLVAHEKSGAASFYRKMGFSTEGPYKFNYGAINT